MRNIAVMLLIAAAAVFGEPAQSNYQRLKAEAERYYAEGSYQKAHELYLRADRLKLPSEEARWVDFRVADTEWRARASTTQVDPTVEERIDEALSKLADSEIKEPERDQVWAEAHESLGDFYWLRTSGADWHSGWSHYQQALEWWAASKDIELARDRYLKIVWKAATKLDPNQSLYNPIPVEVLENVTVISADPNDRGRAYYLIAMQLKEQQGYQASPAKAQQAFEEVLKIGKATEWYDDALHEYARWLTGYNEHVRDAAQKQGRPIPVNFAKALELFRKLVQEFTPQTSPHQQAASSQIELLTRPELRIVVSSIFIPGSEIEFGLDRRNVHQIDFSLYRTHLFTELPPPNPSLLHSFRSMDLSSTPPIKTWSMQVEESQQYEPVKETVAVPERLPVGVYILEANSGRLKWRELILVSDVSVIVKNTAQKALIYFASTIDGAPLANSEVRVLESFYKNQSPSSVQHKLRTGKDGVCFFEVTDPSKHTNLFITAANGDRQAYASLKMGGLVPELQRTWRIYAFTDRPAYRPGETAQWKFVARTQDGSVYTTPANETMEYEITDPRGTKIKTEKVPLNSFGSVWGSLQLDAGMALGMYRVTFWSEPRKQPIGYADLFRLEEYKLPEFQVRVEAPQEKGRSKTYRTGDTIPVNVSVQYYFGAPVVDAAVEVLVYQRPFYGPPRKSAEYAWLYETPPIDHPGGNGPVYVRKLLRTDAAGLASFEFQTPVFAQQDFEYWIEARVTDSSRRQVIAQTTVKAPRQAFYVYAYADHQIHKPGEDVRIRFEAVDANGEPVTAKGSVRVMSLHQTNGSYTKSMKDVLEEVVQTDANGIAYVVFKAPQDGYYRIRWESIPESRDFVWAETSILVASQSTTGFANRFGKLQILLDRETVRPGESGAALVSFPAPGRTVLFTIDGSDLHHYQVVHMTGTDQLIEFPVRDLYVPHVLLSASVVSHHQIFKEIKPLKVAPVQHFMDIDVATDRLQYQPRETANVTITTKDSSGIPVPAEVSLALVDESVFYIQKDNVPDVRKFYFGQLPHSRVGFHSTFDLLKYKRAVSEEEKLATQGEITVEAVKRREAVSYATVEGVVTDENGAPLPGVNVVLNAYGIDQHVRVTNVDGMFLFPNLSPGTYSAVFRLEGFSEAREDRLEVPEDSDLRLRVVLRQLNVEHFAVAADRAVYDLGVSAVQVIRSDFRSTAFWQPDIHTDANGKATVAVTFPDSVTSWKATARAVTADNLFGQTSHAARTTQPLIVSIQAPRFFVVGDSVTVSAVVHNNTDEMLQASVTLESSGSMKSFPATTIELNGRSEKRVDWVLKATEPGTLKLRAAANSIYNDAMEKEFPVYQHGIEKSISKAGNAVFNHGEHGEHGEKISSSNSAVSALKELVVNLDLPKGRRSTVLHVDVSPNIATAMLRALPYLVQAPYGSTEQTMSRFLPAIAVRKTLRDLSLNSGGNEPFRDLEGLIAQSLQRLYTFQRPDGSWGWWQQSESDPYMTAYVLWGLAITFDTGINVDPAIMERARNYLRGELSSDDLTLEERAWILHALAVSGDLQRDAFDRLWSKHVHLNAYGRALLALTAHHYGDVEKAQVLARNLENGVSVDRKPDQSVVLREGSASGSDASFTAHWGEDRISHDRAEGTVETTAFVLKALVAIDPENKLIEPAVSWLVKNRRGGAWSNTRDTAIVVLALNSYLLMSGSSVGAIENQSIQRLKVNGMEVPVDDGNSSSTIRVEENYLRDGRNQIQIFTDEPSVYFSIRADYFSAEEPVTAAGNDIFIRREYFRLAGRPTLLKGFVQDKQLLKDGEEIRSGDVVQVVLTVESKNNFQYVVIEDLKPAGLEAMALRSGGLNTLRVKEASFARLAADEFDPELLDHVDSRWVHLELRDRKVAAFVDKLTQGIWQISYELRAEVPGTFHALPATVSLMYAPDIRGNDRETLLRVGLSCHRFGA